MKRIILLLCVVMTAHNVYSQNIEEDNSSIVEAINQTIEFYIQENMDIELPKNIMEEIMLDATKEGLTSEEVKQSVEGSKRYYLRLQFMDANPSLAIAFENNINNKSACESTGFDTGASGYNAQVAKTNTSCGSNTRPTAGTFNTDPFDIPPYVNATIVPSGNDPIVQAGGFVLPQTSVSERAVRINQKSPTGIENKEVVFLKKSFVVDNATLTFDFATVFQHYTNSHTNEEPYFKYTIAENTISIGGPSITDCYALGDSRLSSIPIISGGDPYLFSLWQTVSVDVSSLVGKSVTLTFEVADCGYQIHAGYAYVDEIRNCTPEPPVCPPTTGAIHITNEGGGGLCTSASANILSQYQDDIDYVNWSWALGGEIGTVPGNLPPNQVANIYYPPGNWTGYYLVVSADVVLTDGTVCEQTWGQLLLDCGSGNGDGREIEPEINLFPNPSTHGESINFEGIDAKNISNISVLDLYGNSKLDIKPKQQHFEVVKLIPGIYIVRFETTEGLIITKKIVIK